MTKTEEIISALENWFVGDEYYNNLVDSIRWLIYNRNDIDKDMCIEWLNSHDEEIRKPNKYYSDEEIKNNINNIEFVEIVGKVNK